MDLATETGIPVENTKSESSSVLSKSVASQIDNELLFGKEGENIDDAKMMEECSMVSLEGDVLGNATLLSGGINLLKTFIGAGIISLPLAIAAYGLVSGLILMMIASIGSLIGLYFYIVCANKVEGRRSSPETVAALTYPALGIFLDLCISLKSVGVSLSYLLLIGNITSTLILGFRGEEEGEGLITNPRFWIACFMIVVGPLSFLRRMDSLKYSSMLGIGCVVYLTMMAVISFFIDGISDNAFNSISLFKPFSMTALSRFGIFVFSFTCHQNIFLTYNETRKNSVKHLLTLCIITISVALTIYVTFGTLSYITYADVLKNGSMFSYYPKDKISFQLARIFFALLLAFSYPLQVVPFRVSFPRLFIRNEGTRIKYQFSLYIGCTCFILLLTFGISMFNPDLSNVLSLVGSMTSSIVCYILPSIFYLKLPDSKEEPPIQKKKWLAILLLIFGVGVMGVCTTASILNFFQ